MASGSSRWEFWKRHQCQCSSRFHSWNYFFSYYKLIIFLMVLSAILVFMLILLSALRGWLYEDYHRLKFRLGMQNQKEFHMNKFNPGWRFFSSWFEYSQNSTWAFGKGILRNSKLQWIVENHSKYISLNKNDSTVSCKIYFYIDKLTHMKGSN